MGLCDTWRIWHPNLRAYTHTSAAHGTHSCIDQIWTPAVDIPRINHIELLPRGISDHSPIILKLGVSQGCLRQMWKFSAWYLQNPKCVKFASDTIEEYFSQNLGSVDSVATLWAASKPTIRGHLKGFIRSQERERTRQAVQLELEIRQLENLEQADPPSNMIRRLVLLRQQLRQILLDEAKLCWRATTHKIYEHGDKSGKLLCRLATNDIKSRVVPAIINHQGARCEGSQDISEVFARYYKTLYAAIPIPPEEQRLPILRTIPMPKIAPTLVEELNRPLSLEELEVALTDLNSGKSPGPDGFPAEFLKKIPKVAATTSSPSIHRSHS